MNKFLGIGLTSAQNFIDIFNNYAETPIKLWWYGDSTKITTALVHNNTASLIECTKIPNYDAPNENIRIQDYLDFIDFFDQFLGKLRE